MLPVGKFLVAKCLALASYYALINYLGLGLVYKFISFNIATPLVKYFHFNRLETKRDQRLYAFSILNDLTVSMIYFGAIIPKFVGPLYCIFPLFLALMLLMIELAQHRALYADTPYIILTSTNPLDFLLTPTFVVTCYVMSLYIDFDQPPNAFTFPIFLVILFNFDAIFGILHYAAHVVPFLCKKHMLHHEYDKKIQINGFANFYADIIDSINMNAGFLPSAALVCILGRHHIAFMELFVIAASAHLRYNADQMNLLYFFEWDLIDMVFKKPRITLYHARHHLEINKHYSAFGIVPDDAFRKLFSTMKLLKKTMVVD